MPKRRRERDRPKAGPEAAYNPNKRVLLSYDSDGEELGNELEQVLSTGCALLAEAPTTKNEIAGRDEVKDHNSLSSGLKATGHEEDAVAGAEEDDDFVAQEEEEIPEEYVHNLDLNTFIIGFSSCDLQN